MQEADTEENDAQKEYETMMAQSAAKRAQDSQAITQKTSAKAQTEEALEAEKENKAALTKELMLTLEAIKSLHMECDWLLNYYSVRKEARTSEIESLEKAKAVLSGADYSLIQGSRIVKAHSSVPCPSTEVYYTDSVDAAGASEWKGPIQHEPEKCFNVGYGGITALKVCGPADLVASRMTCQNHGYKAVEFGQSETAVIQGDCKVYKAKGTYVDGWLGSFSYRCAATAR